MICVSVIQSEFVLAGINGKNVRTEEINDKIEK